MAVFAKVVELGSFRRAADALGLSASVVSHHVASLEKQLGVTLLYRSTRHLSPTPDGAKLYASCQNMVQAAEDGLQAMAGDGGALQGRLWIVAPGPFSSARFLDHVASFVSEHPQLQLRLDFDDRPRNIVQEGIDLAIRFGAQPDSALISRKLFDAPRHIFAAPDYLARRGEPKHPAELAQHEWLCVANETSLDMRNGEEIYPGVPVRSRLIVSNIGAIRQLACDGLGLVAAPFFVMQEELQQGRLREVLPDWESAGAGCFALYPARLGPNAAARRFVDFVLQKIETTRNEMMARRAARQREA